MTTDRINVLEVLSQAAEYGLDGYAIGEEAYRDIMSARDAVAKLIAVAKRAENRLNYLNTLNGKKIDADIVIDLRAALARVWPEP